MQVMVRWPVGLPRCAAPDPLLGSICVAGGPAPLAPGIAPVLVTLVLAARDQCLRNRPSGVLA